ncbi:coniferyl aldehyde dehydrogenase [Myxococcota bacterium]
MATSPQPSNATDLEAAFARQRTASRQDPAARYEQRVERLKRLLRAIRDNQDRIAAAISSDFGNRSLHESKIAEIFTTVSAIKYTLSHLRRWMKPDTRSVSLPFAPGGAKVIYQPLGVVGVISPWNYPFQLGIVPLASALAAGNCVMLKPSELTPATSELTADILAKLFEPELVYVALGGPELGATFSGMAFDHLFFTGSTRVGRLVMRAASENLTPVTLELGGKSPAIVHDTYPIEKAADRIAAGKMFNAGQTCIAPDYVLAPEDRIDSLVEAIQAAVGRRYPSLQTNPDFTSIISVQHRDRLRGLIDDAKQRGARVIEINPASESFDDQLHKLPPTLLLGVNDDMAVMQEEIFGPVLPVLGYREINEAFTYVTNHPRPLALYYFDRDKSRARSALARTVSGGVSINDTMLHVVQDDLPFGGVGPSGMGAYHGHEGFRTFSHAKGVFHQGKINAAGFFSPPFGDGVEKLLKWVIGS